jgi:hypothetical protein
MIILGNLIFSHLSHNAHEGIRSQKLYRKKNMKIEGRLFGKRKGTSGRVGKGEVNMIKVHYIPV